LAWLKLPSWNSKIPGSSQLGPGLIVPGFGKVVFDHEGPLGLVFVVIIESNLNL
jgi:hypothetical protein